ncbi:hypothetical protein GQ457_13G002680 [Hibiscus cannabinus]
MYFTVKRHTPDFGISQPTTVPDFTELGHNPALNDKFERLTQWASVPGLKTPIWSKSTVNGQRARVGSWSWSNLVRVKFLVRFKVRFTGLGANWFGFRTHKRWSGTVQRRVGHGWMGTRNRTVVGVHATDDGGGSVGASPEMER